MTVITHPGAGPESCEVERQPALSNSSVKSGANDQLGLPLDPIETNSNVIRPIPSLRGYSASTLGNIYGRHGECLSQQIVKGHNFVKVEDEAGRRSRRVSHLVLEAFHGKPSGSAAVARYLDGNRQNNRLSNLAWGTRSDVAQASMRNGTHPCLRRGEQHLSAKLSDADVGNIVALKGSSLPTRTIAECFGVTPSRIRQLWHAGRGSSTPTGGAPEISEVTAPDRAHNSISSRGGIREKKQAASSSGAPTCSGGPSSARAEPHGNGVAELGSDPSAGRNGRNVASLSADRDVAGAA